MIAAVILGGTALVGGRGSVIGTTLAVLVLGVMSNGMNLLGVDTFWQVFLSGIILLLAVVMDEPKVGGRDGGQVAGPVFREIAQQVLPELLQALVAASPRPFLVSGLRVDGKFPTSRRRQLPSGLYGAPLGQDKAHRLGQPTVDRRPQRRHRPVSGQLSIRAPALVSTEDLVGAAEVVVTKPGYGIIAEAIANDTAVLYTARGHFPEYDVLVAEMPKYVRNAFISHDDLFAGKWESHLDKLMAQAKIKKKPETNGADVAAETLLKALDKPPKKPRGRPRAKV